MLAWPEFKPINTEANPMKPMPFLCVKCQAQPNWRGTLAVAVAIRALAGGSRAMPRCFFENQSKEACERP